MLHTSIILTNSDTQLCKLNVNLKEEVVSNQKFVIEYKFLLQYSTSSLKCVRCYLIYCAWVHAQSSKPWSFGKLVKSASQTLSSDWHTDELLTSGDDYFTSRLLFSRQSHMLLALFDYCMPNSSKNGQCLLYSAYYLT